VNKIIQTHRQIGTALSVFVLLMVMSGLAMAEIPGTPTDLTNTTGDCWINHTWVAAGGNVTNSYNVSINGVWHNTTTNTFYKEVYSYHLGTWQNITIWAYNSSGDGNLSASSISQDTQVTNCTTSGLLLTAVITILNQIPGILEPIPDILAAMAEVAIYAAVIALAVGIVYKLKDYIGNMLKFNK
jgi:hypothetical protein